MNGAENDSQVKLNSVTSDNPWVSFDSTSYPGLKFYVNKVTGVKVWNITESEIAFAEKAGKDSRGPVHCPIMDQAPDSKIYNNQFSNQLSNLVVNPVPVCSPINVWDNGPNSAQQTYTLVPTAIAQAYQQLLPLAHSFQNSMQHNHHGTRQMNKSAKYRKKKWINKEKINVQNQSQQNQYSHTHRNPDLRNKITLRRRSVSASFSDTNHEGYIKMDPGPWNDKKHRNEKEWEETSIQMNLEPLKLLTSSDSESNQWYIVVDTDVILNNFNYLNNMAAADPDCHLLIPHHVMLELQSHASDNNNVQARRIFRFLHDQIQSGLAMLGEELAGEGRFNMAIMTCVKLAALNDNVILISNNPDTLKYKSNTKYIHVFTIHDVKDILANKSTRLFSADSPTIALPKITVPNDIAVTKLEQTHDFYGSDDKMRTKSVLGVRFSEKFESDFNQSPLTVTEELSNSVGKTFLRANSIGNVNAAYSRSPTNPMLKQIDVNRSDDIGTGNVSRTQSIEDFNDACSQSPTKHIDFKHTDDVETRNVSRANSVDNIKIVYSPSKRLTFQEHINADVGDRNLLERSGEHLKAVCSQSLQQPRTTHQEHINIDVVERTMLSRSAEQYKIVFSQAPKRITHQEHGDADAVNRNILARSAEQFKMVRSLSPPKIITRPEQGDANAVNRNILARSAEQFKMVRSLSPPKRITHQEQGDADAVNSNILARSAEQFKMVRSLSPPKRITHQEQGDADAVNSNILARSAEHFKMVRSLSPLKSRITHQEHENVDIDDRNMEARSLNQFGSACGQSFQTPWNTMPHKEIEDTNVADDTSFSSSNVSLDTIRMKRIISMKRLTSINKTQTKSITSDKSKRSIKSPEMMQQINRATSSRSSYDNGCETSTDRIAAPNIIVEETSTSGIISNSESSHSEIAESPIKKDVKKVSLRSVVMFNIACQSMEDVLRTRCDEWVFRFVQIMEEVLRVKLQEKLPFDDKQYPAPRDLQEAARSVIKKFSNNFSVVDAANKLSFMLYKTSDDDGKIAVNIQPSDYMEMYSYGVFLVETFQDMSADCKKKDCMKDKIKQKENQTDSCSCHDVNAAYDSLKKLLYDIQNANLETFVDHPRDLSADNNNPDIDQYDFEVHPIEENQDFEEDYSGGCHVQRSPIQQEDLNEQVDNLYNLRSRKRKSQSLEEEEAPPKVSMSGKGSESQFFKSLQLQRTIGSPNKEKGHHSNDININRPTLHKQEGHLKSPDESRQNRNLDNLKIHFSKDNFSNAKSQSKVVCNFTVNADIERRVEARQIESEYEDFDDNNEINTDTISPSNDVSENRIEMNDESNKKFKCFMGRLARTLVDILTQVKLLCNEYVKINELTNVSTKREMLTKMEMAYMLVGNIHDSLVSISKRDHNNVTHMQMLLKVAKLQDYIPGDKLCSEYRYMINKCKEKAEEFLNTIRNLLKMVRVCV